jgi:hypothetical protein
VCVHIVMDRVAPVHHAALLGGDTQGQPHLHKTCKQELDGSCEACHQADKKKAKGTGSKAMNKAVLGEMK